MPEDRRHAHHKNPKMLADILERISVPGSLGGDAGVGSASIFEAAYGSGRKVIGAEIDEEVRNLEALPIVEGLMKRRNYGPDKVCDWLKRTFEEET